MDAATMISRVFEAGVVGAGGAGFPTHVKLQNQVEWLIANGAECEPLLYADQMLMEQRAAEIVRGLEIAREVTGATHTVIALKAKYQSARQALAPLAASAGIEIFPLPDFYPAGDEQILVHLVTGRIIPAGGIPLHAKTLVQNVETLINITRAVDAEEPVTIKYLTVTGTVKKPISVGVPVGTPLQTLVELAGGPTVEEPVLMVGGVLMGRLGDASEPVTKRTGGLILLPRSLPWIRRLTQPRQVNQKRTMSCIQCRFCTELCPRFLLGHAIMPNRLMLQAGYGLNDKQAQIGAFLCSECGLCEAFSCPEGLMPRQTVKAFKQALREAGIRHQPGATPEHGQHPLQAARRVASGRLKERLAIKQYDQKAPLLEDLIEPERVELPLVQHVGVPAVPVVEAGAHVAVGDPIARPPEGKLGAVVHASINGQVASVTDQAIVVVRSAQPGGE